MALRLLDNVLQKNHIVPVPQIARALNDLDGSKFKMYAEEMALGRRKISVDLIICYTVQARREE